MENAMVALRVENITKSYDSFKAVENVSFSIEEGRLFGLLGPNGAGKTTTMRMIMNIIIPDSGKIFLFDDTFTEKHKNIIGYLPEERGLYPKMTVLDHLQFLGELKGLSSADAKNTSSQWLKRFDLLEWEKKKIQELSKGMQQKVQFIGTIMHSPKLLILDEPFSGLDPVNTKFLKDILIELKNKNTTIILSTHLMDQAEKLCDDICLINKGRIVMQGNLQEKKEEHGHNSVILEYSGDASFIKALPMVEKLNDYGNYMAIQLKDGSTPQQLLQNLAGKELEIKKFEAAETSLNEIFIEIVEGKSHG
jgi:ABC-2 type transport system ATP-binding protein